jgi:hypothetical protein
MRKKQQRLQPELDSMRGKHDMRKWSIVHADGSVMKFPEDGPGPGKQIRTPSVSRKHGTKRAGEDVAQRFAVGNVDGAALVSNVASTIRTDGRGVEKKATAQKGLRAVTAAFLIVGAAFFVVFLALRAVRALRPSTPPRSPRQDAAARGSNNSTFDQNIAISIAEEIACEVPVLNDEDSFRQVRALLQRRGTPALLAEIVKAGVLDSTGHVSVQQPEGADEEQQKALGPFQQDYIICDAEERRGGRHRQLLLRDVHWQWFNVVVFGLVAAEEGGVTVSEALQMLEAMRAAAKQYVKTVGWSTNVGLYFDGYGHTPVHFMCMHVVDMSELPEGFQCSRHLPFDAVVNVLREEAATANLVAGRCR